MARDAEFFDNASCALDRLLKPNIAAVEASFEPSFGSILDETIACDTLSNGVYIRTLHWKSLASEKQTPSK